MDGAAITEDLEHLRDMASEAPVIRLVNAMIAQAVEKRASDIHIEPFEKEFRIRFRMDGVLFSQEPPPRELKAAIISRLKLMAKLNIAERRLPQDGRIKIKTLGREVDLRVSTLPTLYGESVVMRLLDRSAGDFYDLRRLGFDESHAGAHGALHQPAARHFPGDRPDGQRQIDHALLGAQAHQPAGQEDHHHRRSGRVPDGRDQPDPRQSADRADLRGGLRHIVRQDPDVIMVGEIRDRETADIAIRAALTGHFVFSTLHTNDAPSAITRLTDMGVENYLITSSLVAVLAQRLVRVICPHCKQPRRARRSRRRASTIPTFRGAGCDDCFGTGYTGRVGIFEMMEVNDEIRKLIMAQRGRDADHRGGAPERHAQSARRRLAEGADGVTTVEEVMRVTQEF